MQAKAVRGAAAALGAGLLLGACQPNDADPGPGGVTVGEARALDDAAEMLDQRRAPAPAASGSAAARPTSAPR